MPAHVINHPLVQHKLGLLRFKDTSTSEFRHVANELASLLIYEASRDFPKQKRIVEGWAGPVEVEEISGKKMTVVPVLRAGLGLLDGVLSMIPSARISVVGLYRDEETLEPQEYYVKLAHKLSRRIAVVLDPMLATGGSMRATIDILKKNGCQHICAITLVCAPEGVARVEKEHPDVNIYTAAIDERLNENGYIIPGLGDAGDRLFGTK